MTQPDLMDILRHSVTRSTWLRVASLSLTLLMLAPRPTSAQIVSATLLSPADAATQVPIPTVFHWTSVPNVQAYYLYVGTTPGANDVINTGEIQQTSYTASNLPEGQALNVTLWTKKGGTWRPVASTFTTTVQRAGLTAPGNGAQSVGTPTAFSWTTVSTAQAYYLYVGTTVGANDVVNTGETLKTSWTATLPQARTFYVRLWTKVGGTWRSCDSSFATATVRAHVTSPADGAQNVALSSTFQWTTVPNAQAYYLYVGTTVGSKDVVDTGETSQPSYSASNLPPGRTLYARLWTKTGGVWNFTDSTLRTSTIPTTPTLTNPPSGSLVLDDMQQPITWTSVPSATAYYLYVGTSVGLNDLINSGETQQLSYSGSLLPRGRVLCARIHAKVGGQWYSSDSTFTIARLRPEFIYPIDGAIAVQAGRAFQWFSVAGAEAYRLSIGTTLGGGEVLSTGDIQTTSYMPPILPASGPLYARAWTRRHGQWAYTDAAFTGATSISPARIVTPADGFQGFDAGQPFVWDSVPMARGYRLQIGTVADQYDLHDSGEMSVPRRFVRGLPVGVPLFGRVSTMINGSWLATTFTFSLAVQGPSTAATIAGAEWATVFVREMANGAHQPFPGTALWHLTSSVGRAAAVCSDYATTLLEILQEMNLGAPARVFNLVFNPYTTETHTLVEVQNPADARWILMDPTFAIIVRNRQTGQRATALEVSDATRSMDWTRMEYVPLSDQAMTYLQTYYIDYPLLYLNVLDQAGAIIGAAASPNAYVHEAWPAAPPDLYMISCGAANASVAAQIDGSAANVSCSALTHLSGVFWATSVQLPTTLSDDVKIYKLKRYVF